MSTDGGRATTVTSSTIPFSGRICASRRSVVSARSWMPSREYGLYDSFSRRSAYVPGGREGMRKRPAESVTTICSPCRLGEVAVTTTSATGAFVAASMIVPVSVPWLCCASKVLGESHRAAATAQTNQRQNVLFSIVSNSFACDRQKAARRDSTRRRVESRWSVPSTGHFAGPGEAWLLSLALWKDSLYGLGRVDAVFKQPERRYVFTLRRRLRAAMRERMSLFRIAERA